MIIKVNPPESKSLREALESEGFRFPCGGKGLCGRCRIIAPALAPTALDRRFLSDSEIAAGLRLACDKSIDRPVEIDCLLEKASPKRKLYEPVVTVVLGDETSEISILEDGIVETLVLPSPAAETVKLRSLAGKNAIELYEKYGVAKASVILAAGTAGRMRAFAGTALEEEYLLRGDTLPASDFDMPSEEVYLPPFPNAYAGSLALLELDALEDKSFLMLAGQQSYSFFYKGDTLTACAGLLPDADPAKTAGAVCAALAYFKETFSPIAMYLIGRMPEGTGKAVYSAFPELRIKESAATQRAAAAITDNRYKTRLDKLSRKAAVITLSEEERFQEILEKL